MAAMMEWFSRWMRLRKIRSELATMERCRQIRLSGSGQGKSDPRVSELRRELVEMAST